MNHYVLCLLFCFIISSRNKDTNSLNILEILSWDLLYFNTLKSEIYSINTYSYTLNCKNPDISEL
jgi:hypothetical protein